MRRHGGADRRHHGDAKCDHGGGSHSPRGGAKGIPQARANLPPRGGAESPPRGGGERAGSSAALSIWRRGCTRRTAGCGGPVCDAPRERAIAGAAALLRQPCGGGGAAALPSELRGQGGGGHSDRVRSTDHLISPPAAPRHPGGDALRPTAGADAHRPAGAEAAWVPARAAAHARLAAHDAAAAEAAARAAGLLRPPQHGDEDAPVHRGAGGGERARHAAGARSG
mmetsp:Transcript_21650/g.38190  ORF Transcript_21650/g.38190 Transcript_21650/m.38190 type:complete len:225 (+) Transcript_21650:418-1092(+)